jgi:hypothetical protein
VPGTERGDGLLLPEVRHHHSLPGGRAIRAQPVCQRLHGFNIGQWAGRASQFLLPKGWRGGNLGGSDDGRVYASGWCVVGG